MTQTFIGYISQDFTELKHNMGYSFGIGYKSPLSKDSKTVFIRCTMFKDVAAVHSRLMPYLKKGKLVAVSGYISDNTVYQGKDGEYKANLRLTVSVVTFVPNTSSKSDSVNDSITSSVMNDLTQADADIKF